jgi:predicted nucleic acid-binding protein
VTVTAAVVEEVRAGGGRPGRKEVEAGITEGWIEVAATPADLETLPELAAGEASTLLLAVGHQGDRLVLMDEPLGRARARTMGVPVTGVAGILVAAKHAGLVAAVRPLLERLEQGHFRLAPDVVRAVLEEAGEV